MLSYGKKSDSATMFCDVVPKRQFNVTTPLKANCKCELCWIEVMWNFHGT